MVWLGPQDAGLNEDWAMYADPRVTYPGYILTLQRARWRELSQQAQAERIAQRATAGKPGWRARLLAGIGSLLIEVGQKLQGPQFLEGRRQPAGGR